MSVTTFECFEKRWDNTRLMMPFTFLYCAFVTLSGNLVLFESLVSRATISLWPQQRAKGSVLNVFRCEAVKVSLVCSCSDSSSVLKDDPHQTHNPSVCSSLSHCAHTPSNGLRVAAHQKMTFYYSAVSLYYSIVFVSIIMTAAWQPGDDTIQRHSHFLCLPLFLEISSLFSPPFEFFWFKFFPIFNVSGLCFNG